MPYAFPTITRAAATAAGLPSTGYAVTFASGRGPCREFWLMSGASLFVTCPVGDRGGSPSGHTSPLVVLETHGGGTVPAVRDAAGTGWLAPCGDCGTLAPVRIVRLRKARVAGGSRCGARCLQGGRSCDCRCAGRCHGSGTCRCPA